MINPRKRKAARRGHRRLRPIAGALIRELERKLPAALREEQRENFSLYRRVLAQKPQDTDKIYSLHEPHIYCVAKGKEHKGTGEAIVRRLASAGAKALAARDLGHQHQVGQAGVVRKPLPSRLSKRRRAQEDQCLRNLWATF
jgi:hypothetical protein